MELDDYNLTELPLFRDLTATDIAGFIAHMEARVEIYPRGERLLRAYELNSQLGFVLRGEGQVVVEDCFGNESVGHRIERGAMLGASSAILTLRLPMAVEALSEVHALWLEYGTLVTRGPRLGRVHGIVMKNILELFCRRNVRMMQKLEIISQKSLRERVILYIMQREMQQLDEPRVSVPGRIQLARELECNRSALTREIGLMQREGLLICGEGWMQLDHARLVASTGGSKR